LSDATIWAWETGKRRPARVNARRLEVGTLTHHISLSAYLGRLQQKDAEETAFVLSAEDDSHVEVVEACGRGVFVKATPIDVSAMLHELLFDRVCRAMPRLTALHASGPRVDLHRTKRYKGSQKEKHRPLAPSTGVEAHVLGCGSQA
jgi:hypothetical protein